MTPYVIFVIVLTIAYIIYYGYNVSKDLSGKKNQEDTTEETFDIDLSNDQPAPTEVRETGDGFSLGDTVVLPVFPDENEDNSDNDQPAEQPKIFDNIQGNLHEADVQSSGGMYDDEFMTNLLAEKPATEIIRQKTIIKKRTNV